MRTSAAHGTQQAKNKKQLAFLINDEIERIRGTIFRQTMFAEFEHLIHRMEQDGEALTADKLTEVYYELNKKYFGDDLVVDEEIGLEWARIPHFYYNFYVYQYATSFTASAALSEQVLTGDKAVTKHYFEFLSSGGSDYPINLLKKAGVDMTTSAPFEFAMRKMNHIMDEIEKILDQAKEEIK